MGIGQRIQTTADAVGTQQKLADAVNVSLRTMSSYINESSSPKLDMLEEIAQIGGVSLEWLVFGEGAAIPTELADQEKVRDFYERLQQLKGSMNEAEFARMVGIPATTMKNYYGKSMPSLDRAAKIATAFGKSLDWLYGLDDGAIIESADISAAPVIGLAACGSDGWAHLANSHFNAEVPHQITNDPDAFAVISTGSSMQPFGIYEGYLCWCSPAMALKVGHIVCVERRNQTTGEVMLTIKKLGVIGHGAYEIIGYEPAIETPSDATHAIETQKVFWETVPENEIERISVVTHILTTPTIR